MNKLIILSLSFVFLMIVVLPLGLTLLIKVIPGGVQPPLGNTEKIYEGIVLSQTFISPEDNLTGIGVSIKNPNFANRKKTTINIYDEGDKLIRTIILNGQNIADGKFVRILFEPIIDSKNKKFTWSILSPESVFTDALEVFLTDKQPTWSLDFRVDHKISPGGLSYVTLHRRHPAEVLTKVISGWIYKITEDGVFFLAYGLLLLGLISALYFPNLRRFIGKNKF